MPKAAKKRSETTSRRKDPIKRGGGAAAAAAAAGRDAKASHLYTDDNPATTLHGTGFKDRAAAERTLELISKRSLTYQFQTVNTMFHRAKHHPAMEGNAGMREAMGVFRTWLDETYPAARAGLRLDGFRPLLSKECVGKYLGKIMGSSSTSGGGGGSGGGGDGDGRCGSSGCSGGDGGGGGGDSGGLAVGADARGFANAYVALPKGKRLANVLMDDGQPGQADWERRRCDALTELVAEGREQRSQWESWQLWLDEEARVPTAEHLRLIAWAWSPVPESKLRP
ncbi:hypothetical protein K431DRAFT_289389 [Polychaeton citri CBS 116435]|uniref:Uncharacterized protein n=1 Tax=Polychaeton citri CBS 116435 TaxID=1314669 RepID=A0A9P4PZ39_9PEZI|nr:hypothetical protein K431DRAFT_289389 [Polychaeton citri CBS 116435]